MATSNQGMDYTIAVTADLSACQYSAITHAGAIAATGQDFFGIMQGKPLSGEHGAARLVGVTKFRAGNGVAVGDFITPTTSGFLIKCESGFVSVGECVGAVGSGGIGSALLRGKYYVASL